jgi:hypothetical protein
MGRQGSTDEGLKSRRRMLKVAVATATLEVAQATQMSRVASIAEECPTGHGEDWIWLGNRFLRVGLL